MKKITFVFICLLSATAACGMDRTKQPELKLLILKKERSNDQNPLVHLKLKSQTIKTTGEITDLRNTILYASGENIPTALSYTNTNKNGGLVSLIVLDNVNRCAIEKCKGVIDKPILILVDPFDQEYATYAPILYAGIKRLMISSKNRCSIHATTIPLSISFLQDIMKSCGSTQQLSIQEERNLQNFFQIQHEAQNTTSILDNDQLDVDPKTAGLVLILSLAVIYLTYKVVSK